MGLFDKVIDRTVEQIAHSWNVFQNKEPTKTYNYTDHVGRGMMYRPDKPYLTKTNEGSIISSIMNRIALDVSMLTIRHVKVDENGMYLEDIDSELNECLKIQANIDQTAARALHDGVMSMFDEGCIAVTPIETDYNPETQQFDVESMRMAKILEWYPEAVRLDVYNQQTGIHEEVTVEKSYVSIIENPLFAVMNEENSTLTRLKNKLILLDSVDNQSASGKLDIIIQLPYVIKTQKKREEADKRKKEIEMQLQDSKYGIVYTDGSEKITQLNRPVENNLMGQVEYLTSMLYGQLGLTESVMDGTADDKTMLNYYNRTVYPIVEAFVDEYKRKFLTREQRNNNESIMYFKDVLKTVPVSELAEIADKLTRNEILSPNEIRAAIGYKPSTDPAANELRNRNISMKNEQPTEGDQNGKENV